MVTDHLLIRRAARELDRALRGCRIRDAGFGDDGSIVLVAGGRGSSVSLRVLPFGSPPLLWLSGETPLALEPEPAWLRAAGAVLRGQRVVEVRVRRGDRVIRVDLEGRSRFGVVDRCALILELVPRFGNVLVLKGDTIVAAAKTFAPSENAARSVEVGGPYEPPPAPAWRIPRLLAGEWSESRAAELEAIADSDEPVHVYRRDGELVAVHLVPLAQFAELDHSTAPALLDVFAEAAAQNRRASGRDRTDVRREELLRKIGRRRDGIDTQLAALAQREAELARRDDLRKAGETIYAYLAQIPEGASQFVTPDHPSQTIALDPALSAKQNASRYFERYRKAGTSRAHAEKRRASLERERAELETLLWEIERADADSLREIAADLGGKPPERITRKPTEVALPSGARLYVGRSPRENAEVTFRIARPDDLWFHARNVPGAHVVLHRAPGVEPSPEDIAAAAGLAAQHSRARNSAAVEVDYALRKYVRKQRDAKPGMVWYTNFKTIRVAPAQLEAARRLK